MVRLLLPAREHLPARNDLVNKVEFLVSFYVPFFERVWCKTLPQYYQQCLKHFTPNLLKKKNVYKKFDFSVHLPVRNGLVNKVGFLVSVYVRF